MGFDQISKKKNKRGEGLSALGEPEKYNKLLFLRAWWKGTIPMKRSERFLPLWSTNLENTPVLEFLPEYFTVYLLINIQEGL